MDMKNSIAQATLESELRFVYTAANPNQQYVESKKRIFISRCHDIDNTEDHDNISVDAVKTTAFGMLDDYFEAMLLKALHIR